MDTNGADILSNSPDTFLDAPQTKVELPKVTRPDGERNVCVQLASQGKAEYHLLGTFSALCASKQAVTRTHHTALLVIAPGRDAPMRLGYCDTLTADNLVLRLCLNAGIECTVIRDYDLNNQRILTAEDLGKRPFRF